MNTNLNRWTNLLDPAIIKKWLQAIPQVMSNPYVCIVLSIAVAVALGFVYKIMKRWGEPIIEHYTDIEFPKTAGEKVKDWVEEKKEESIQKTDEDIRKARLLEKIRKDQEKQLRKLKKQMERYKNQV